jgi:hypothetical protein
VLLKIRHLDDIGFLALHVNSRQRGDSVASDSEADTYGRGLRERALAKIVRHHGYYDLQPSCIGAQLGPVPLYVIIGCIPWLSGIAFFHRDFWPPARDSRGAPDEAGRWSRRLPDRA